MSVNLEEFEIYMVAITPIGNYGNLIFQKGEVVQITDHITQHIWAARSLDFPRRSCTVHPKDMRPLTPQEELLYGLGKAEIPHGVARSIFDAVAIFFGLKLMYDITKNIRSLFSRMGE